MILNLSLTPIQAELPPLELSPNGRAGDVSESQIGLSANSDVEQELDAAIRELGEKMVQADKDGDPTGRDLFRDRMYAAIASRTPQHQARLTAEAEKRIEEARITNGLDYFQSPAALELGQRRRIG